MYAARTATRGETWDKGLYSLLVATKTPKELAKVAKAIKQKVDALAQRIALKRAWK